MENLKKPPIFKRLSAMVFDILIWFLLSMFVLLVLVDPITNKLTNYNSKNYEYNMNLFDAYAVVYAEYKENGDSYSYELVCDAFSSDEDKKAMKDELLSGSGEKRYLLSITTALLNVDVNKYMTEFYVCLNDSDTYKNAKLEEKDLFDENGNVLKDAKKEDLNIFYSTMYTNAFQSDEFKSYDDGKIYNLGVVLNRIDVFKAYSSYLFSLFGLFFIVPIITKRRQTLGKLVMKIMVVNQKTNKEASRIQMFVRFLALAIIEFLLAMLLSSFLFLPLLVSLILMVVTLNQSAIHDFIAKTKVVEIPYVNPYLKRPIEEENGKEEPIDAKFKEI